MIHVNCSYRNGFITLRSLNTPDEWLDEEAGEGIGRQGFQFKRNFTLAPYMVNEQPYKLRYQPSSRLFWHKFPKPQQQQQEDGEGGEMPSSTEMPVNEMTTATPPSNTEIPEQPETTETPTEAPTTSEPETEPPPPLPTETELPPITVKPSTTTTTSRPMKPSTTFSTIMKPYKPFPYNIAEKLKNLFVYGSPSQVNLIQKQGGVLDTKNKNKTKSKGFLSLFEVIKFANTKCTVNMGDIRSMHGICYHEFECKSLGGISTERCGEGLGVCCIFLTGCGDTIGQSVAYFESPNYPQPVKEMLICVLIVNLRPNVQQLRLDFLMFEVMPVNVIEKSF
ncbi:hypothetical protein DOY81_002544 [Sarcophaga bullata]|nr:hypothetical protein DOY81_002544 [Sarcophaga bullata]